MVWKVARGPSAYSIIATWLSIMSFLEVKGFKSIRPPQVRRNTLGKDLSDVLGGQQALQVEREKLEGALTAANLKRRTEERKRILDREKFEEDKQTWYKARGCDKHGIPTKKTLKDLDLSFIIPILEKTVDLEES